MRKATTALVGLLALVLSAIACGSNSNGDAEAGNRATEDIAAAAEEGAGLCDDLLVAGEVFSAEDEETCKGPVAGGYSCDSGGTNVWIVEDSDGNTWFVSEGERPVQAGDESNAYALFQERCPQG